MYPILRHLDSIAALPDGGYAMPAEAREFFEAYLKPYGFSMERLSTHEELLETLSWCNSQEFTRAVSKPAPSSELRFIWPRLRKLAQSRGS